MSKNETSLRETALSFSPQQVGGMTRRINDAIARRDEFEAKNGGGKSWEDAKKGVAKAEKALAMFLLALDVDPKNIFERHHRGTWGLMERMHCGSSWGLIGVCGGVDPQHWDLAPLVGEIS